MGLHIVIGYGSASKEAAPQPVYLGYSASDAAKAKEADTTSARFEEFHHATGLRKNNPRYIPAPVAEVVIEEPVAEVVIEEPVAEVAVEETEHPHRRRHHK